MNNHCHERVVGRLQHGRRIKDCCITCKVPSSMNPDKDWKLFLIRAPWWSKHTEKEISLIIRTNVHFILTSKTSNPRWGRERQGLAQYCPIGRAKQQYIKDQSLQKKPPEHLLGNTWQAEKPPEPSRSKASEPLGLSNAGHL